MVHALKTVQPYFDDVLNGKKPFEVRKSDRPYRVGDIVALNEWDGEMELYTGNSILAKIAYILNDPLYVKEGYVIFTIKPITICNAKEFYIGG